MIFGTDGIRAPFKEEPLTKLTITKLSQMIASQLKPDALIVVGFDTRESGGEIKEWLQSAWSSFRILDLAYIPTPVVAFETQARNADLGVMITASHNPFQDNGLKFFNGDGTKISQQTAALWSDGIARFKGLMTLSRPTVETISPTHYDSFLKRHFQPLDLQLVFDLANGANCGWAERWVHHFFPNAGVIGNQPDGKNINLQYGALHPENLAKAVLKKKAAAGFAFDGDGDRLVVVNGKGDVLHGDRILYGLACIVPNANHIVTTIMAGLGLEQTLSSEGKKMTRTAVGDQHVLRAMMDHGALVGGEASGHYISADLFPAGDGFLNALRIAKALHLDRSFLIDLEKKLPVFPQHESAITIRIKTPLNQLKIVPAKLMALEEKLASQGRCVLRYSGTEKKIRLFVEAQDLTPVKREIKALEHAIQEELQ